MARMTQTHKNKITSSAMENSWLKDFLADMILCAFGAKFMVRIPIKEYNEL